MNQRSIVVDDDERYGRRIYNNRRTESKAKQNQARQDTVELETLQQQQRIKEKQLLLQWKAIRETEKKIRSIMRNQSRDIHSNEKHRFAQMDRDDYARTDETDYVWKHHGCNAECKADDCMSWKLESGLNY
jgi:hypothetical protein